jgi:hypothetical protein
MQPTQEEHNEKRKERYKEIKDGRKEISREE